MEGCLWRKADFYRVARLVLEAKCCPGRAEVFSGRVPIIVPVLRIMRQTLRERFVEGVSIVSFSTKEYGK
jgi:hypothetical protein